MKTALDRQLRTDILKGTLPIPCWYCGTILVRNKTLDHKIPVSRGGKWEHRNLTPACKRCNQEKSFHTVEEYRELKLNRLKLKAFNNIAMAGIRITGFRFHGERGL